METVVEKDRQIASIESSLATAVAASAQMMEKYDREMETINEKLNEAMSEIRKNTVEMSDMVKKYNKKLDATLVQLQNTEKSIKRDTEEVKGMITTMRTDAAEHHIPAPINNSNVSSNVSPKCPGR